MHIPKMQRGGFTFVIQTLNEKQCLQLLASRPPYQRNVKETNLKDIVRDFEMEKWRNQWDPIRISADGELIDGQHRLMAMIKTNHYPPVLIISGYDGLKDYPNMDKGAFRTCGDFFKACGCEKNQATLASASKFMLGLIENRSPYSGRRSYGYSEQWECYDANRDALEWGYAITDKVGSFIGSRGGCAGVVARAVQLGYSKEDILDQLEALKNGIGSAAMSALRRTLVRDNDRPRKRIRAEERVALFAKALEYGLLGKDTKMIKLHRNEKPALASAPCELSTELAS